MWTSLALCVIALAVGANADCSDVLVNCNTLDRKFCLPPHDTFARDACAMTCGFCDGSNASSRKRSHNNPDWLSHCWDNNSNHLKDPFCALLTTTTTSTTTTTMPTTTTTTVPTTTTTEPTTTTTVPTTTTTEPTTTTTTPMPTTTARTCTYEFVNNTDISNTNFGTDVTVVQNANITINESVHLLGGVEFCQGVCEQSILNDGYECWAFTYNEIEKCYLYYYTTPIYILDPSKLSNGNDSTTIYLKRCSNDPKTPAPTIKVTTTTSTQAPVVVTTPTPAVATQTPIVVDTTTTTTQAPVVTTPTPAVATQTPIVVDTTTTTTQAPVVTPFPAVTATTPIAPISVTGATTPGSFGPNTGGPGGIVAIDTNSYLIKGLPSPTPNTCFFINQTFAKGLHWKEGCRYDCECTDVTTNTALCKDICPYYTQIPSNCQIVKLADDCCNSLQCDNTTVVNTTVTNSTCGNKLGETCDYYGDNSCFDLYEPWARANCALRCGYCDYKEPCVDRLSYCNLYDLADACTTYEGWARHNCKASCNKCAAPKPPTNTTTAPTQGPTEPLTTTPGPTTPVATVEVTTTAAPTTMAPTTTTMRPSTAAPLAQTTEMPAVTDAPPPTRTTTTDGAPPTRRQTTAGSI